VTVRLEHANLIVRDIDVTVVFLQIAFPEFRIRFDSKDPRGMPAYAEPPTCALRA
jgi:hypothetical protein